MRGSVTLAAVQPRANPGDEVRNVEAAVAFTHQAAELGAEIVVFPECYPGPYSGPLSFSAFEALSGVASKGGLYIGYGYMEPAGEAGGFYNVYQVVGPTGDPVATYRKVIPSPVDPELSNKRSVAGDELVVFDAPWGKVGILICWEAWFPELCRTLAWRGADLVVFPTGGMLYHLRPVWHALLQARATENLIYTASCVNLFGVEEGFAHICSPEGEIASSTDEGVLVADLDLDRLDYLRGEDESLGFPKQYRTIPGLWRHNRPEFYQLGDEFE